MRLRDFKNFLVEYFRRSDYEHSENVWHAKMLCFCRHRVLNEPYEKVAEIDRVLVGQLIHKAVEDIVRYDAKVYRKEVGKYVVVGTPDLVIDNCVIEVKFTQKSPDRPRDHDVLQLSIYLWLTDFDVGYLWYISPDCWKEFEVTVKASDSYILDLIEKPKYPMWWWECKNCSLFPCEVKYGKLEVED